MTEWREIPSDSKYPGLTSYTTNRRTFSACGIGPAVRTMLRERAEKNATNGVDTRNSVA